MRNCFVCYADGDNIRSFFTRFEDIGESEIIHRVKNYHLGELLYDNSVSNLLDVKNKKLDCNVIVEFCFLQNALIINLLYPTEINDSVWMYINMLFNAVFDEGISVEMKA